MSRIEKGIFPLKDIQNENIEGIRFSLNLPDWIDQGKIGVNLQQIYKMCQMGGIENLTIIGSSDGETSTFIPSIVAVDEKGAGIAGKAGLKREIPFFSSSNEGSNHVLPKGFSWINAAIDINLQEINSRISAKKSGSLRDSPSWIKHLDQAVRKGVTEQGIRHLIRNASSNDKQELAFILAITLSSPSAIPLIAVHPIFSIHLATGPGLSFFLQAMNQINPYTYGIKQRWSLFPGPQLDRALILKIMSKTQALIKEIKNDKDVASANTKLVQ